MLEKYLAQNSDTFKLHRFPACVKQIILKEVWGSRKESNFLHGSLHFVGTGISYAEKS